MISSWKSADLLSFFQTFQVCSSLVLELKLVFLTPLANLTHPQFEERCQFFSLSTVKKQRWEPSLPEAIIGFFQQIASSFISYIPTWTPLRPHTVIQACRHQSTWTQASVKDDEMRNHGNKSNCFFPPSRNGPSHKSKLILKTENYSVA